METVAWIDPEGATTTFSRVELNLSGRFFPSLIIDEETIPGQAGSRLWDVRHGPLEFSAAAWVSASTESALRTAVRAAVYALDPTRGTGTWRNTGPGGDQRDLRCVVTDGLGLSENDSSSGRWAQRLALTFRAHDPYWQATADTAQEFTLGAQPSFFPILPIRLASSEVVVEATVTNPGDVPAWPVWTITGPGSGIVLRNMTTDDSLTPSGLALAAGSTLTVDSRVGIKSITRSDGANMWSYLTADSSLWPLRKGANVIRLEMAGTTAASRLALAYRPRYLSP